MQLLISQMISRDWDSACSAAGLLTMEVLRFDGFANGFMDNITPKKQQKPKK
jgi:hypothetical protein